MRIYWVPYFGVPFVQLGSGSDGYRCGDIRSPPWITLAALMGPGAGLILPPSMTGMSRKLHRRSV